MENLSSRSISERISTSYYSSSDSMDFISNVPDNVADEILKRLPIHMAATTSVLSKQWRRHWLSLSRLWFLGDFWIGLTKEFGSLHNLQVGINAISRILYFHNCSITSFLLIIPVDDSVPIEPWLCLLAKNAVKQIGINSHHIITLPSDSKFFSCNELQSLGLGNFALNPPPNGFKGFPKLTQLVLRNIKFTHPDSFSNLIANSRQLTSLDLKNWTGMDHVVIDVPSLRHLRLDGVFESLVFRNVGRLEKITVCLKSLKNSTNIVRIKDVCLLATSSKLHCIQFNGFFCKFLAAGGITSSLHVAFNHLKKLCLIDLDLGDISVFRYVFGIIESYPRIKELDISVVTSKIADQHKVEYNKDRKLSQLVKIKITGITGSSSELELIEYLLTVSEVLEEMLLNRNKLDSVAELKVLRALSGFRRASPMARVLFS